MGKGKWLQHIGRIRKLTKTCYKEEMSYYARFLRLQEHPVPYQEPELEDDASLVERTEAVLLRVIDTHIAQEQTLWKKQIQEEMHQKVQDWMIKVRSYGDYAMPIPRFDEDWRNSWWLACWEEEYATVAEEHRRLISRWKEIRRNRRKKEAQEGYQESARKLSNTELEKEIPQIEWMTKLTIYLKEWEGRHVSPDQVTLKDQEVARDRYFSFILPQDLRNLCNSEIGPMLLNIIAAKARSPLTEDQAKTERALWGEMERRATLEWTM
jgi:uncharacterized protein with von Willebrand factor type A (vWA) domain